MDSIAVGNVEAWLSDAPEKVRETTSGLLSKVAKLRESETIYPPQDSILNALACTPPSEVSVVILGQDPYHGPNQAMGLSFSVPSGQKLPPSLRNIYKEMVSDLSCSMPSSGDLTAWAKQGVLLLNATLTVREHAANSHSKLGWQTLTNYLVGKCFDLPQPVVFLAWGRNAIEVVRNAEAATSGLNAANKLVLESTHPSPLSANRASGGLVAFMGSKPFSRTNKFLKAQGAKPVDWVCLAQPALPL